MVRRKYKPLSESKIKKAQKVFEKEAKKEGNNAAFWLQEIGYAQALLDDPTDTLSRTLREMRIRDGLRIIQKK